jgi:hypothetical protein
MVTDASGGDGHLLQRLGKRSNPAAQYSSQAGGVLLKSSDFVIRGTFCGVSQAIRLCLAITSGRQSAEGQPDSEQSTLGSQL